MRIIDPADKSDGYLDPDVDVEEEARYPWRCLNTKYAINTDLTAHDLEQLAVRHAAALLNSRESYPTLVNSSDLCVIKN